MTEQDRKVAIITGGSQGIGAGLVAEYRRRGWAVVATSRTIEPAADPELLTVDGDISQAATTDRIIGAALERFGRVDTLVNNAGVYISKPFTDYSDEDYATVVGVNLTGFFALTQRAIGEMLKQGGGHVVNISTTLADYANSSAAVRLDFAHQGWPRLGHEVAGHRVRLPRHPGERGLARHHSDTCASGRELRRPRYATATSWPRGPGQRHRRWHPLPRIFAFHHRRDPAYRRWPNRGSLTRLG